MTLLLRLVVGMEVESGSIIRAGGATKIAGHGGRGTGQRQSRAARCENPAAPTQRLKAVRFQDITACLKACPDTNRWFQHRLVRHRGVPACRRRECAAGRRPGFSYDFTTCKLLVTEKMPETVLARRPARFLSDSLSTTPSRFTRPFLTMIRIGFCTPSSYL
jgi:hypothetical protein